MSSNGGKGAPDPRAVAALVRDVGEMQRDLPDNFPPDKWEHIDDEFHNIGRAWVRDMTAGMRWTIGLIWLPFVGVASLVGLLWMYPHAERTREGSAEETVHWLGPDFSVTSTTSMLLAMVFAAVAGCIVQAGIVFSMRSGKRTLERGYEAWYFLRPVVSGLLGALFGLAIAAGVVVVGAEAQDGKQPLSLAAMVSLAALAGLFTDKVLQSMQRILGATDPDKSTIEQSTPGTPDASKL